jgi:hypothetical protein
VLINRCIRLCAALLLLGSGCSSPSQLTTVERVGPAPRTNTSSESAGYLEVYSAWSNFVDQGSTAHHSRYIVKSDGGSMSKEVINHADRFDEGPIQLPLAPGAYHVSARSAHYGRVNVPVIIEPRRTTIVYLDGRAHPAEKAAEQASAVRLPNGEIVGWSSTQPRNGTR